MKSAELPKEAAELKGQVLVSGLDPYAIQAMERAELVELQRKLGYGAEWGRWQVPSGWISRSITPFFRCEEIDSVEGSRIWTEALRVALLLSLVPLKSKYSRGYVISPSTVRLYGSTAVALGRRILHRAGPSTRWWSRLKPDDFDGSETYGGIVRSLRRLCAQGLIPDAPPEPTTDELPMERDRHGEPEPTQGTEADRQWQPFPDVFTAEMGKRVHWFATKLGPCLLDCYAACLDVTLKPTPLDHHRQRVRGVRQEHSERQLLNFKRTQIIRNWNWCDSSGNSIAPQALFQLNLRRRIGFRDKTTQFSWPPSSWGDIVRLVTYLQGCHAWMLFLAAGARNSTVADLNSDCLIPGPDGYRLSGTQWKVKDHPGGRKRDWPLPRVLERVVVQQVRLCDLAKRHANPGDPASLGNHLWVKVSGSGGGQLAGTTLGQFNLSLKRLVKVFGLLDLLDKANPTVHSHRFRKTLARLVALALSSAQTILMDCFGHEDPDHTLGYMLSDKTIVADALRVQREVVILMAKGAIEDAENLGGPFGDVVREQVHTFLRHKGRTALEPEDAYELADQLTLGGRQWIFVMEGVICTLNAFSAGPCGEGRGLLRDPLNCQAGCKHQLILAYHKNRCNELIGYMLPLLQRAIDEENELLEAELNAKLLNHLFRWQDVFEAWRSHPLVARIASGRVPWWQTAEHVS